jgi:transposase
MLYAGLDVHKTYCFGTLLDEGGRKIKEGRFPNTAEGLENFFDGIKEVKVVIEATSFWLPVYEHLEGIGIEVILSHPLKTKAIAEARIKTDRIDSATLAHLLRSNLVPASYIPPREIRELREIHKT